MADFVVMPPLDCCSCAFCTKRRWELELAARIEREWAGAIMAEIEGRKQAKALERDAERNPRDRRQWMLHPHIQRGPATSNARGNGHERQVPADQDRLYVELGRPAAIAVPAY